MKVYCVFREYEYEGDAFEGVFATEELAKKWIEGRNRPSRFKVEEYTVQEEAGNQACRICGR